MSDERPSSERSPERPTAWKGLLREAFGSASVTPAAEGTTSQAPSLPASTRFTAVDEIDRDETSVLVRGRDLEMDREVSLRILEPETDVAGFLERIQIGAQLQHPGIVPVYAFGLLEDGRAYVARRFVEGETFADLLVAETGSHRSENRSQRLLAVLEQTAHALAFAHTRGVAHTHLTAERIVVGPHGEVVVTGWDRAVCANGDPAPIGEDVRALGALLAELDGELEPLWRRCLVADDPERRPCRPLEAARAIGAHLARAEEAARRLELRAAERRARAEEARSRESSERRASRKARAARRWTLVASTVAVLSVALGAIGMFVRRGEDRAAEARASLELRGALREAARHEAAGELAEAVAWAKSAVARASGAPPELEHRAREANERLDGARRLLATLEELRARRHGRPLSFREAEAGGSDADVEVLRALEPQYAAAFRRAGVDVERLEAVDAAAAVRARSDPIELAAALEEWAALVRDPMRARHLIEVARLADPDPWRDAVRRARLRNDSAKLRALIATADRARQPVRTLVLLAWSLRSAGDTDGAWGVLREALRRQPQDAALHASLVRLAGEKNEPWRARQIVRSRLAGVAHRPDDGCRWDALAKALVRQGDVAGGVAAARRSTELDASHADHWRTLATAQHRAGCHEDAVGSLEEAARLRPGDADLLNDLGVALNEVDRWAEALAVLDEALSVDPEHARTHNNRGVALDRLDRLDEAIDAYGRAAELEPDLAAVHFNLGTALRASGRIAEAVAELGEAVRLDPEDALSWYELGVTLHNHLADYEGAVEAYRTAIRLDPNPALFHESLGRSLVGFGNALIVQERFGEAVEAFLQAVQLRPDDLAGLVGLGGSLAMAGRHEEALGPLGRARELDDGVWQVHVNLAIAQRRLGRYAESIASYRRALKLAPVLGVLDNFAWLLATCPDESLRDPAQAVRLAWAAVSLDRESGRLRQILGVALYRAGRCDDAVRELNCSRALASEDDATTCLFLAMAHARLGREDEARGWCAKAVTRMQDDKTEDEQLARFRTEAEALLGR